VTTKAARWAISAVLPTPIAAYILHKAFTVNSSFLDLSSMVGVLGRRLDYLNHEIPREKNRYSIDLDLVKNMALQSFVIVSSIAVMKFFSIKLT
jgi:hypothetical protein